MFTASPGMQQQFKFAKNKTLKQLETSPRLAIHASNVMNVICQVNIRDFFSKFLVKLDELEKIQILTLQQKCNLNPRIPDQTSKC